MPKSTVIPKNTAPPLAPYSPGARADGMVYTSGLLPMDAEGQTIAPGDVRAQTRAVLDAVKAVVEEAGGTLEDVAFNAIFLKDLDDYAAMNEVYAEYFPQEPPARYCIRADLVRAEFLVEISSIAHVRR